MLLALQACSIHRACYNALERNDHNEAIRLCTTAIESGKLSQKELTTTYNSRGNALYDKGDYEKAIDDYTRAIKIDPKHARVYYNRGLASKNKGDYERAIEDYTRTIEIDPKYVDAFIHRGNAWVNKGDYERAIEDYTMAIENGPKYARVYYYRGNVYFIQGRFAEAEKDYEMYIRFRVEPRNISSMLWLYLARERAGKEGRKDLAEQAQQLDLAEWPGPVFSLYLGNAEPYEVLETTKDTDKKVERERRCEALFYLGQYYLLRDEKEKAKLKFMQTIDTGVTNFFEYRWAEAELERLGL
jgi:lipoprotein NlpI